MIFSIKISKSHTYKSVELHLIWFVKRLDDIGKIRNQPKLMFYALKVKEEPSLQKRKL